MILVQDYKRLLKSNGEVIRDQIAGLTKAEMLLQPPNGGNCMLWVLGHLVDSLREIATVAGTDLPQTAVDYSRFAYDSQPLLADEAGLPSPEDIMADYAKVEEALFARLDVVDEAFFAETITMPGGKTPRRGWRALFYAFHHGYHIGQLELLRNLAGHTEKLI